MTNTDRFVLAVLGLVAVAAVAYLATALMPPPDLHPLRTKFWELLVGAISAFGTLAAVVVALHLGRDGQRRLDRAEQLRAKLTAAKIAHLVHEVSDKTRLALTYLAFSTSVEDAFATLEQFAAEARPILESFTDDDFLALMPLPEHVGGRLAASVVKLRVMCKRFEGRSFYESANGEDIDVGTRSLNEVNDPLIVVSQRLQELASGAAPAPTSEEVHGWSE